MIPNRKPRVLRNLVINEISTVDKGAGEGVQILLAKAARSLPERQAALREEQERSALSPIAKAARLWGGYLDFIAARDKVSVSKAVDIALREETGRELFALAKQATAVDKLGGAGFPNGPSHGVSPPSDPHNTVRGNETGEEALSRLRQDHARKVYTKYMDGVRGHMASGKTQSQAHDAMRMEMAATEWTAIKNLSAADVHVPSATPNNPPILNGPGRSPVMLLSSDATAIRPV
jgi:hypothetical protein